MSLEDLAFEAMEKERNHYKWLCESKESDSDYWFRKAKALAQALVDYVQGGHPDDAYEALKEAGFEDLITY